MKKPKILLLESAGVTDLFFKDGTWITILEDENDSNTFEVMEPEAKIKKPYKDYLQMERELFYRGIPFSGFYDEPKEKVIHEEIYGKENTRDYELCEIPPSTAEPEIMTMINEFIFF